MTAAGGVVPPKRKTAVLPVVTDRRPSGTGKPGPAAQTVATARGVAEDAARGAAPVGQQELPKSPVCVCPAAASVPGGGPVVSPVPCAIGVAVGPAGTARGPDGAVPVGTGAGAPPQAASASTRATARTRLQFPLLMA